MEYNLKKDIRNKEWFEEAVAVKLASRSTIVRPNQKPFARPNQKPFARAKRKLVESVSLIVADYSISLSEDESLQVGEEARNALHAISENYMQNYDTKSLIDSLEFYSSLARLPTIIKQSVSVKDSSSLRLYKEIVRFNATRQVWYLPTEVTEDISLVQAQSDIAQCYCLSMEGLGLVALNLRRDYGRYLL